MRTLALAVGLGVIVACSPAATTTTTTTAPAPDVSTTSPAPVATTSPAPVATTSPAAMVTPIMLPPGVQWSPAPASLPTGARVAVIDGDPSKEGLFTMRLWMPNDYRIPPHTHPAYEHITIISGVLHLGMGNAFTMSGADELRQGAFKVVAPNMAHFVHAAGEVVLQLHGMGPWSLKYVNPADDPRTR